MRAECPEKSQRRRRSLPRSSSSPSHRACAPERVEQRHAPRRSKRWPRRWSRNSGHPHQIIHSRAGDSRGAASAPSTRRGVAWSFAVTPSSHWRSSAGTGEESRGSPCVDHHAWMRRRAVRRSRPHGGMRGEVRLELDIRTRLRRGVRRRSARRLPLAPVLPAALEHLERAAARVRSRTVSCTS